MTPAEDTALNAANRSVYIADNLHFLRALNSETIDLVCIDPPFAKNETFGRKNQRTPDPLKPPLTDRERQTELDLMARWGILTPKEADREGINWPETVYKDFWSWEQDVHEDWLRDIENDHPAIAALIEATRQVHSDGTAAYLCYMAVRLFEIRRVLKDTGSLYLHCDHTAGAYLRQLLDGVFGNGESVKPGFVNEIIWRKYAGRKNNAKRKFSTQHDSILFYRKSGKTFFNKLFDPISNKEIEKEYKFTDEEGRKYRKSWGRKYQLTGVERRIYLEDQPGSAIGTLWVEGGMQLNTSSAERSGYPTQKPIALAERIIRASCPEDGVVLDCFAGCAYVAVAAERLGRQWITCDINPRTWTVFKRQFNKPQLALLECREPTEGQQVMTGGGVVTVHGPRELPERTSPVSETRVPYFKIPERKFKVPSYDIPEREMLEKLLELSNYEAWCCGFANRMPDGTVIRTTRNFHLDHLNPRSLPGYSNRITNRAPMCPYHNIHKSNRRVHLAEYRQEIADAGDMMVAPPYHLIDLNEAVHRVEEIYVQWRMQNDSQIPLVP